MSRLDFPPISDLEGFGLGRIFDPEMLKEALVVAGGATVSTVVYTEMTRRWLVLGDRMWKRLLLASVIGIGGKAALESTSPALANGVIAGMGAQIGLELLEYVKAKFAPAATAPAGYGGYSDVASLNFGGYGDVSIDDGADLTRGESHRRAFADVTIDDEQQFASVLSAVA